MPENGPFVLIVLDGWGHREEGEGNACRIAETPRMNGLLAERPDVLVRTSGEAVGLPEGQMGNSEVGHQNLGAGRIVHQDLTRIAAAIEDGSFFENEVLLEACRRADRSRGRLHLLGLCSDGGIHSHITHLLALLELASRQGLEDVVVHAFTDGRDTDPKAGAGWVETVRNGLVQRGLSNVATVSGRYYAMDRDERWDRTRLAWEAIVHGEGPTADDPVEAVRTSYADARTDEFIVPTVILDGEGRPWGPVRSHDGVLFFNFRSDRARQLTRAFIEDDFEAFDRGTRPDVHFATMTRYDDDFDCPVAFPPTFPEDTLGEVLARAGLRQLRIAETEKYAHVTYFFNGRREDPSEGEEHVLIPSPKVPTYDMKPEMSAREVTDELLARLREDDFDVGIVNYANPDMVGHTGDLAAAVTACEAVDRCLGEVVDAIEEAGGQALITADHGNAEMMIDPEDGGPHTAHTTNPTPCILVAHDETLRLREGGRLADIAPTILDLLDLEKPEAMTGESLLVRSG